MPTKAELLYSIRKAAASLAALSMSDAGLNELHAIDQQILSLVDATEEEQPGTTNQ